MPKPGSISGFAPISQMAYVPSDFDAAIAYWTEKMGVGPFFLFENIALDDMRYCGEPTDAHFTVAIAYWGDVQIELVKGENDAPAHYNGEYGVKDQLHHVLQFVDDFDASMHEVAAVGGKVVVSGGFGGGKVAYVDLGAGPGGLVEILQPGEGAAGLFEMIKSAGIDWDGSDPVRRLG
ncbi:MAG: VOC family protein [Sphingomonadales bacterium]|nr:VOC family protein [Sphingomonadales bacterium]MDE2568977.1 VOC family protein [Sphingomonadales bacterium]